MKKQNYEEQVMFIVVDNSPSDLYNINTQLKEYYEIVMKLSNLPSFRAIRALMASQSMFEK